MRKWLIIYIMQPYCKICGRQGHWPPECPTSKPIAKVEEIIKRPWVKPTITRWVKAEVFTPCEQVVNKPKSVNTFCEQPVNTVKELRKAYRREWMRKKRARG